MRKPTQSEKQKGPNDVVYDAGNWDTIKAEHLSSAKDE